MGKTKIKLILASASPRRKELLAHLQLPFEVKTLNIPEESLHLNPVDYCMEIAAMKGDAVLHHQINYDPSVPFMVVSADTIVCLADKIYGKPRDRDEARNFLRELSGKTHSVFTAVKVSLYYQEEIGSFSFVDESKVAFNHISPELLENYLLTRDSLDKAGAYGIQGPSLTFISEVNGSYSNVVGFPLSSFVTEAEVFFKTKFPEEKSWLALFR